MTSDTVSGLADAERSSATIKAENILRQRLRITSLNPQEVAEGLRRFFPKQAAAMDREVSGLPSGLSDFYQQPRVVPTSTTSDTEFDRAKESIEQDLKALGTDNQLKEVDAELEGWGHAIRSLVAEGRSSALMATDPRSRDRALACRRQLSDYARMARLAGTFNPNANTAYRRLAQSIDQTAALILVSIGEAMAELGGSGGQVTLAAPLSELQARRDAVMSALRCLTGVNDDECGDFPRGVFALRMLHRWLDEGGHAELRAYLNENTLARAMDDLIDRAANGTGRGLRALGATASVALAPLERIVDIAGRQVDPESPTLSKLCNTLGLFIDAFRQNSGHRLLAIARPAIIHGGLHRTGSGDNGALRLQRIVGERGRLALQVDCLTGCDCAPDRMIAQIMLDGVVSGIDRAINLYALGTNPMADGEAERQAAAYGLLMSVIRGLALAPPAAPGTPERFIRDALNEKADLLNCLGTLSAELLSASPMPPFPPAPNNPPPDHRSLLAERELESHWRSEVRWLDAAPRFGDACTPVINYKAAVQTVLIYALQWAGSPVTGLRQPKNDIPAAVATSQAKLAFNRPSTGF